MKLNHLVRIALLFMLMHLFPQSVLALSELGNNPFHPTAIESEAEMKAMLVEYKSEVKEGLIKAGQPELYEPLYEQLADAEVERVQYQRGRQFDWMFYRKKGQGRVRIDKDVVWESDEPLNSFLFAIDHEGQRYTMAVPPVCGNLTLAGIGYKSETRTEDQIS